MYYMLYILVTMSYKSAIYNIVSRNPHGVMGCCFATLLQKCKRRKKVRWKKKIEMKIKNGIKSKSKSK